MTLPTKPTGRLAEILATLQPDGREALEIHLLGGTSADWLARILTDEGYPISATSIRSYRQGVKTIEESHNLRRVQL
jgi:hypothetical protein